MTSRLPSDLAARFDAALAAYGENRTLDACALLAPLLKAAPRFADAHHLMALCLINLSDFEAAERSLAEAVRLDKKNPALHALMGDLLRRPTRFADSERSYRAALAIDRRFAKAVVGLAGLFNQLGRAAEACELTAPLAASPTASIAVMEAHAEALKTLGRTQEALDLADRAAAAGSPNARVDRANILRELGRYEDSETAAREAFVALGEAPGAHVVHARTLHELGRYDEAEAACRQALTRAPLDDRAHGHLAELIRRRTNDSAAAQAPLDSVLRQVATPGLVILKAKLLEKDGRRDQACALLAEAVRQAPDDVSLRAAAAKTTMLHSLVEPALIGDSLAHAEHAYRLAHDVPKIAALMGEVCLAAGQPERTAALAEPLLKRSHRSDIVALQAAAWRLMGDPRYGRLCDYDQVVGSWIIETPDGWPNLKAYLADLAATLNAFHEVPIDAFGLTRGHGMRTKQNLADSNEDTLRAFYKALDGPIREHLARVGTGSDPLRRRNRGAYRPLSAWSVKALAGAFHDNHLHEEGWLSSAFYVDLPPAVVDGEGRQGWIKFGETGFQTKPALPPEHYVKPDPGRFVLFPSYMWHGTLPFEGEGARLIMSVDFIPE